MHEREEDLILHYYGEGSATERAATVAHIRACAECRESAERLKAALSMVSHDAVPARGPEYGAQVWQRLRPRLPAAQPRRWSLFEPPRWSVAAAAAAALVVAFVAGRYWSATPSVTPQVAQGHVRERVLLVAVGDHLERSQMVLLELMNQSVDRQVDISSEQESARELVASNRLYRQTAARAGEPGVESVLDELEPILLEIVHGPSVLSPAALVEIRQRIEAKGILFKVRVIGTQVREREKTVERGPKPAGSQVKQI